MATKRNRVQAVAYMRTSSAANVGADKDSLPRQRKAIASFAKAAGYAIDDTDWYYDPAVTGDDAITDREGFARLLGRIDGNGVRTVIVEDVTRFARKLLVQELGIVEFIKRGVRVVTATGEDLTDTEDEMRVAFRQMAGTFSQLEKTRLVKKLKAARLRKKEATGKCEGRKSHQQRRPEAVALARDLAAAGMTLRAIAARLEAAGHVNENGKRFNHKSIGKMLTG